MRWEDERYVRIYTRDTGDWLALSFEAQALFLMLLRKLDRIGELPLGKRGKRAIGACVGHAGVASLDSALDELLEDGCVCMKDASTLFVPNFLKAQEISKTPAERKREQRERDAEAAAAASRLVTGSHAMSRESHERVTGHEMSPRAVPSQSVPSQSNPPPPEKPVEVAGETGEFLAFWEDKGGVPSPVPDGLEELLAKKKRELGPDYFPVMSRVVEDFHSDGTLKSHRLSVFILPQVLDARIGEALGRLKSSAKKQQARRFL